MKIDISYRHVEFPSPVEAAISRHLRKISALLKRYSPDLVQLHGAFDKLPHKSEFTFSLNLSLPTGTLHANGDAPNAPASARQAFLELEAQIKKHQARLRKDREWKRKPSRVGQVFA
jgi:ribosome-associated translation inhibitor RaiA